MGAAGVLVLSRNALVQQLYELFCVHVRLNLQVRVLDNQQG